MHRAHRLAAVLLFLAVVAPRRASSQERGAVALDQDVRGLSVTGRVLVIGAHPDDEDTQLIAWLARGRRVETAYLSLTRGDGGQNLIGNELGEALGAIRTEELLAARRVDGGHQFFTRAFDFGFSKSAAETFRHWNREALLGDIVTVIRAFRPQVVVSVWSGTPADGHGHHQVSGILAREAYDVAGDTVRFPPATFGRPWEPQKFYRGARFNRVVGTLGIDVGAYDVVIGRSYAEIAAESRAQHRSQGFGGAIARKGAVMDFVARQGSRVNESTPPTSEHSLFDGVDTTFARLGREAPAAARPSLDSLLPLLDSARRHLDLHHPETIVPWLAHAAALASRARAAVAPCLPPRACDAAALDLDAALDLLLRRTAAAALATAGIDVEATAAQDALAIGDSMPVHVSVFNRGRTAVTLRDVAVTGAAPRPVTPVAIAPDSSATFERTIGGVPDGRPWWIGGRVGDMFAERLSPAGGLARAPGAPGPDVPGVAVPEDARRTTDVELSFTIAGSTFTADAGPLTRHTADPVLGEQDRPVAGVPAVTLQFDRNLQWVRAGTSMDQVLRLTVRSWSAVPHTVALSFTAPPGVRVDSVPPSLTLGPREQREIFVRLRGSLRPGRHRFAVAGESGNVRYAEGFSTIEYPHIRPIRMFQDATVNLQAEEIAVPTALAVGYVQGVGDVVAPFLSQLGIPVTIIAPDELALADLSRFTAIVVGTRAYEAHPELVANNGRLLDFARNGGTLVVQYGQFEMARPGLMPFPIGLSRPAARVTEEDAAVTVLDPTSRLLTSPNPIGAADWAGWVQERALYMPSTIDPHYEAPIAMHDTGEPDNRGAILVAPLGKGLYVYTTLALFRQIPGGVPGGPRLFVNLLSAGLDSARAAAKRVQP